MESMEFKKKNGAFDVKYNFLALVGSVIILLGSLFTWLSSPTTDDIVWSILALLLCSFLLYLTFSPYLEKYCLEYPILYVKKGRRLSKRSLPEQYSVIISDMSIKSSLDVVAFPLAGKNYVSIIDSKDEKGIIDKLHNGPHKRYSSAYIEETFQYAFFDGFIYDKTIPDVLFENAESLIIPRSILNQIEHYVLFLPNLVIDEGY